MHGCSDTQGNSVERAADWVFSHAEELDAPGESEQPSQGEKKLRDGPGSEFECNGQVSSWFHHQSCIWKPTGSVWHVVL